MGRPIEIAARLRDLNTIYGRRVIVSEAVHRGVQEHFHCRILDAIQITEGSHGILIYELIAERSAAVAAGDLEMVRGCAAAFEAYRDKHWGQAIALWEQAAKYRPEDPAIRLLIGRCKAFQAGRGGAPRLPEDWDGSIPCPALPIFA